MVSPLTCQNKGVTKGGITMVHEKKKFSKKVVMFLEGNGTFGVDVGV